MFKHIGRFLRRGESTPEFNSGIPVESAVNHEPPLTIQQMVQRYVRETISAQASRDDNADPHESIEEADDFEEEDPETVPFEHTHHQIVAMDDVELRGIAAVYGIDIADPEAPQEGESSKAPPATAAAVKPQKAGQSGLSGSPGENATA